MTQTAPSHRSHSQLNTYRRCGEQYRLTRIEQVPERPSVPAAAGVAVHEATELVDQMIHEGSTDAEELSAQGLHVAESAALREIAKHPDWPTENWRSFGRVGQKQDWAWWWDTGLRLCLDAYVNWRTQYPRYVLADLKGEGGPGIEVPFDIQLADVQIIGKIDRVFVDTETGQMFAPDLKSGNKPKTDEQLGLYRAALKTLGVETDWGFYLYGLKTGVAKLTPPIDLTHWTAEKLYRVYGDANRSIEQGIFIPNPGEACWLCPVTEHCEFFRAVI